MKPIPLVDLWEENSGRFDGKRVLSGKLSTALYTCAESSAFIGGKYVKEFEEKWAKYIGVKHMIGVSNATDGLFLSLSALGINRKHFVGVQTNTVTADAEAILMTDAAPVFIDTEGHQVSFEQVKMYGNQIDALILVHMYGAPHPQIEGAKRQQ